LAISHKRQPRRALPGRSTVGDISRRHGLVPTKRPPRRMGQPGQPTSQVLAPTDGWRAEFNGQVTTGDGPDCSPLPGADGDSRSLRGGQALSPARVADATPVLTRLFKAFGWPKRLRTDNGVPFATAALGRLSPLPAWWGRRGRFPEGIGPGTPQPTGRPERRPRPRQAGPPPPSRAYSAGSAAPAGALPRGVQPPAPARGAGHAPPSRMRRPRTPSTAPQMAAA
jgi:putative transposase